MKKHKKHGQPLRILVAEDHATNQKVALGMAGSLGCTADTAGSGSEALEALRRHGYDLILMDVQMPEMGGIDATRRVRRGETGQAAAHP